MFFFDLYCAADTFDEGGLTQMSGCGIVSNLRINDGSIIFKFGYPLGSSGYMVSVAQAIKLGILSIHRKYRTTSSSITIYSDECILNYLSDDVSVAPVHEEGCKDLILEIRELIRPFGCKTSYFDLCSENMIEAKRIATICQAKQKRYKE